MLNSQLMASHIASPNTRCPHLYRNQLCTRYSSLWSGDPCEPYPVCVGCLEGSSSVEIKCVVCVDRKFKTYSCHMVPPKALACDSAVILAGVYLLWGLAYLLVGLSVVFSLRQVF